MSDDRNVMIETFTTADLGTVRDLIKQAALDAGLSPTRTDDLVLAVNELAVNAILHAGGAGSVSVEEVPDGVAVEVRDHGPGLPRDIASDLPGPTVLGGRGLWLVRRLCQQVTFSTGVGGACIRVVMARA